jgi:lysyl-tRNA synthetase class 1
MKEPIQDGQFFKISVNFPAEESPAGKVFMIELWPDKEAQQILKQHGDDPAKTYLFETGFGPSGKPHFGTFGEVVRTNYVMLAMKDRGYKTQLIAFSDDLDGLRKVPEGFPSWLKDYIGKPVSAIPDPFDDQHESYSAHMNALLVQMLEELNLNFEFRSSTQSYRSGAFNEQIRLVIQNYEAVQEIIFPYLRDETKENWFPFLPICENCGRVGNTRVVGVDKANLLISYVCDREFGGRPGCGHQGQISPLNGSGKLQWKVDWPARWHAFGVNYEMFGKDLIESAEVGDRIVQRVFRSKPPTHMFYEMFLDEDGRKISKSVGRGMDADTWQRYGTRESLMYLMLDKPREARRLYPGVIPRYMELTLKGAESYYSGSEKGAADARHYQFIHLFNPPAEPPPLIDFMTLANLVGNVGLSDPPIVEDYLRRSGMIGENLSESQRRSLHELILKARRYYDEQMSLDLAEPDLDAQDGFLLGQLVTDLEATDYDADTLHNHLFEIAKSNNVDPKKFFRALYTALIRQERGPRGGAFIKLIGQATAANLIRERIAAAILPKTESTGVEIAPVRLIPVAIEGSVKARYPELAIGVAVIEGVKVIAERPAGLNQQIDTAIQAVARVNLEEAINAGAIGAYRALFLTFGAKPNTTPPSPENILRMAVGEGRMPAVNNLVDAVNLTVLETGLSAAVYDADRLALPLVLRFAKENDRHIPLGGQQAEHVPAGELIYADAQEVICRALNHRDADKSKITTKTQNILLIVDGSPGIRTGEIAQVLKTQVERITHYAGGQTILKAMLL